MKQYFLHDGQRQIGPFSIEELKERNITNETFVWKEGMSDWVKAVEIVELKTMLASTPPPFKVAANIVTPSVPVYSTQPVSDAFKTGNWIGKHWIKIAVAIIIVIAVIWFTTGSQNSNTDMADRSDSITSAKEKTPEELRNELELKERENPKEYLKASITRRKNLLGENVFEGSITNSASTATFKDITVKIIYLSKTRSVIGDYKFVVYEVVGPKQTVSVKKIKLFTPDETDEYRIDVVSAIAVN